jgi:hypothetical protein
MRKIPLIITLVSLSLSPVFVQAICEGPIIPCTTNCKFCHFFVLINNILSFTLTCLAPITAGLMLIIGGFYFLIAGPSPEVLSQAKSIIWAVVIGLVIVFAAWVFLNTFLSSMGVAEWTGLEEGWWNINCD